MYEEGIERHRVQKVSLLTGVPASTLRAWERRYGVPRPERTESGYRLYGGREVSEVRRMRQLIDSGVPASEAARRILEATDGPPVETPDPAMQVDAVERAFEAAREMDAIALGQILRQAEGSLPAATTFDEVIAPLMRRVGDAWHQGQLGVAAEHLASSVVDRQVARLLAMVQPPRPRETAVLACVAGERHLLPLQGAAIHLAQAGFRTIVLGADTPASAVTETVSRFGPSLVGLSLTTTPVVPDLADFLAAYARAAGKTRWIVGGAAAREFRGLIEGLGGEVAPDRPGSIL